jgi:para-nitrobenzyl esterase
MATVTTASGDVIGSVVTGGESGREIHYFGGVPYATATRFGLPLQTLPWPTPRDASQAGAAPPQRIEGLDLVPGMVPDSTSEDCLTAEVWTPAMTGRKAVLIWIPGGSFRVGSAGLATYDGRHLSADGDVVVVGLNYRLGLLGFLCAPGIPTNLGLRDLVAGIAWVRANIAQFGGDPDRITVMGESAGAGAIMHLLTDPSFNCAGAILLSGSPTMTLAAATAARVGERVLELASAADVSALGDMTVNELLDLQSAAVTDLATSVGMMPFHPWVDGDVVPTTPVEAIARYLLAPVPVVVATTCDEMELFRSVVPQLPRDYSLRMLEAKGRALGIDADGATRGFSACGDDLVAAIADIDLQLPALALAEHHVRRGLPVWRVSFTWPSADHGACHAIDLPFHFGTLDVDKWREFANAVDDPSADRLSCRLRAAWASFAATGTPSCEPIGVWPRWDGGSTVIELGRDIAIVPDPSAARLGSWR